MKGNFYRKYIIIISFLIAILISCISYAENLDNSYYEINDEEKIIYRIEPETKLNEFKEKLNISKLYKDEQLKEEVTEGFVGTDMCFKNEEKLFNLSVIGDFDGDGRATQVEITNIIRHIVGLENSELEGTKYYAADLTGDKIVDQRDITKYIKYIVYGELDLGKEDLTSPEVSIDLLNKTSSSVKVEAKALDKQTGIDKDSEFIFYLKKATENDSEYKQVQKSKDNKLEIKELEQDTEYKIKVEIKDRAGNSGFAEIQVKTDKVPDAESETGVLTFGDVSWSQGKASIEISTNTSYYIEYKKDNTNDDNWTRANTAGKSIVANNLNHNDDLYARLTDGKNHGNHIMVKIEDKINPTINLRKIDGSTNSITIKAEAIDNESGIPENAIYKFYLKKTSEDDSYYEEKQNSTQNTYTANDLDQNEKYTIKVTIQDNAGNEGIQTINETTNEIPNAEENGEQTGVITFGNVNWNSGKASIEISTNTNYYIEYQKNNTTDGNWIKVETAGQSVVVDNLDNDDKIYARLTDGDNHGNYIIKTISDENIPTITLVWTSGTTNSITVKAEATDNESGIPDNPTYKFYLKKTSEQDTKYIEKQSNSQNTYTATELDQNVSYTIKVTIQDNAGNEGTNTIDVTTGNIPDAGQGTETGAITFSNVSWNSGKASVEISTSTSYYIEYQKNSIIEGSWTKVDIAGKSIVVDNLINNDKIYARLTDGNNHGNYAMITITDINAPIVTLTKTNGTTNSIIVKAEATDAESGIPEDAKYKFYLKKTSEDDSHYLEKQNNTQNTYIVNNLEQNENYTIKVTIQDNAGNEGTNTIDVTTNSIPSASGGSISPTGYTKGPVTITLPTIVGYDMVYQASNSYSDTASWIKYDSNNKPTIYNNTNVYYKYTDGINSGNYGTLNIDKIDTNDPIINSGLYSSNLTANSFTLNITITDADSGLGKIEWYYKLSNENTFTKKEEIFTQLNGNQKGTTSRQSKTYTINNLSVGTYNAYAIIYDVAGNSKQSSILSVTLTSSLASQVKVGDYIAYNATDKYTYTSPKGTGSSHGNGYQNQTFTSKSSYKWQVWNVNKENGEVILISEKLILSDNEQQFYLQGGIGYLYAEEEINKVCAIYGHGIGADTSKRFTYVTGDIVEGTTTETLTGSGSRSINVEDIDSITTYNKSQYQNYGETRSGSYFYPTKKTDTGMSKSKSTRSLKITSYGYEIYKNINMQEVDKIYLLLLNRKDKYWLASRCIGLQKSSDDTYDPYYEVFSVHKPGGGTRVDGQVQTDWLMYALRKLWRNSKSTIIWR